MSTGELSRKPDKSWGKGGGRLTCNGLDSNSVGSTIFLVTLFHRNRNKLGLDVLHPSSVDF